MSFGAIIITGLGLAVGLAGLYLAWRLVRLLPVERHDAAGGDDATVGEGEAAPEDENGPARER